MSAAPMRAGRMAPKMVELALAEVGVREKPLNSNCGPRVNEYKAATNLPPTEPWYWCAAFICWIVREALKALGIAETSGFKRPVTAGARDFIRWSRAQDATTTTKMYPKDADILPGDILVFDDISHIALAISAGKGGKVRTVEGNTGASGSRNGDGVYVKTRRASQIRARIRINA